MSAVRILLLNLWLVITGCIAATIANHGWNLFPIFFDDIAEMGWPGQFNDNSAFRSILTTKPPCAA